MGSDHRHRSLTALIAAAAILSMSVFAALATTGLASGSNDGSGAKPAAFNLHGKALPNNSVGSKQIKNKQVKHSDLGTSSVFPENICPDCVGGPQVKESSLGKVPSVAVTDHASVADNAAHADNADHALTTDKLSTQSTFSRHLIPTTAACSSAVICMPDGGNVETLAQIGPIHIDGLCRITAGDGEGGSGSYPDPSMANEGNSSGRRHGQGNHFDEREAQILVWSETGTLSFTGRVGPRSNLPAGPPDYTEENNTGTTNTDDPGTGFGDPVAGEGNHMMVAASNNRADEQRPVPGSAAATNGTNTQGFIFPSLEAVGGGFISLSDPQINLTITAMAGFGVLGIDPDKCVFSGLVQQL